MVQERGWSTLKKYGNLIEEGARDSDEDADDSVLQEQ